MRFLASEEIAKSSAATALGLSFLKGYAHGDGSIAMGSAKAQKPSVRLYITEGNLERAVGLKLIFTKMFGKGYIVRPRGRNYYMAELSLTPKDALFLLTNGFFSHSINMQSRLIQKATDSKTLRRLLLLHDLFGRDSFSHKTLKLKSSEIWSSFIPRAVDQGYLKAGGVEIPHEGNVKWYRSYRLTSKALRLITRLKAVLDRCHILIPLRSAS